MCLDLNRSFMRIILAFNKSLFRIYFKMKFVNYLDLSQKQTIKCKYHSSNNVFSDMDPNFIVYRLSAELVDSIQVEVLEIVFSKKKKKMTMSASNLGSRNRSLIYELCYNFYKSFRKHVV